MEKKKIVKKEEAKTVTKKNKKDSKTVEISVDTIKNVAIIALVLIVIFGFSFMASNNSKDYAEQPSSSESSNGNDTTAAIEAESKAISDDEQADIEEIDVDRYLKLMDEDEESVIYIARPTCHYCQLQGPIMKNIVYQYPDARIYYLNTDEFKDEDQNKFVNSDDMFSESFGTPTTIVVKGGKIVDSIAGATTGDKLLEMFRNNGIIS